MKKDRLASFSKSWRRSTAQLAEGVGRTVLYGKDPEDDSIKDLGDQANSAYNREFLFELGNGDRRLLQDVVAAAAEDQRGRVRRLRALRRAHRRQAPRGAAVRALLHRLPALVEEEERTAAR